ncbi:MAG TPA: hypothetical protein O0X39_04290 [Methanocorpusculum sp.]|nr:hypothetical protein [Methanocorpusculum sp.]
MTNKIPVPVICACICIAAAAICIIGAVSLVGINNSSTNAGTVSQETGQTNLAPEGAAAILPNVVQTSSGSSSLGSPWPVQTEMPLTVKPTDIIPPAISLSVIPTCVATPESTIILTSVETLVPTTILEPTLSVLQIEGINLLAGNWHGTKNIMFVASGTFDAVCNKDFTAVINGLVTYGNNSNTFTLPVTWEYTGSHNFIAKTGDGSVIPFTCDGMKMTMTVNPKKHLASTYPDMEIPIELYKQ